MKNDLSMPVDLKKDTLFTEALIQVENNRFFLVSAHPSHCDGWLWIFTS